MYAKLLNNSRRNNVTDNFSNAKLIKSKKESKTLQSIKRMSKLENKQQIQSH